MEGIEFLIKPGILDAKTPVCKDILTCRRTDIHPFPYSFSNQSTGFLYEQLKLIVTRTVALVRFIPAYSGATVPDFHRISLD